MPDQTSTERTMLSRQQSHSEATAEKFYADVQMPGEAVQAFDLIAKLSTVSNDNQFILSKT